MCLIYSSYHILNVSDCINILWFDAVCVHIHMCMGTYVCKYHIHVGADIGMFLHVCSLVTTELGTW